MHEYYAHENGKIYYAITSRDARENDATQTSEVSKYQIISQPKLDKFQLQAMLGLQQMFEVTAARFHAVTQTFAPLIDSVVDVLCCRPDHSAIRRRFRSCPSTVREKKVKIILRRDRDISKDLSCK